MNDLFVGLMSGTSMDGIDAALVQFSDSDVDILATHTEPYPADLQQALRAAIQKPMSEKLDTTGELHRSVGASFRDAASNLISKSGVDRSRIRAIGSHGQTLRHQPDADKPFSLQIGDPDLIATGTGITTIANFRKADIDAGGQGAPLVPPFHEWLFRRGDHDRVVANIGGIANITILREDGSDTTGFDTGPGNGLMDLWTRRHLGTAFDADGKWAASGEVKEELLERMLRDPYFGLGPPKSTGFEYFNAAWLDQFELATIAPADVQATLCELTVRTITDALIRHAQDARQLFVCGGGARNRTVMRRLQEALDDCEVLSTKHAGLDPDWVEAVAFAWLAMRTLAGLTGNLPSVTGASHKVVLGEIHSP